MSTNQPPPEQPAGGTTPPPGPPPPSQPAGPAPTGYGGTTPPPQTPPAGGYAPMPGAPAPAPGVPHPGGLLDRFLARFIDLLIVGVVAFIINVVLGAVSDSWLLTSAISAVVTAVLYLGYFAYLESNRGQTIGKQVMKLKVVGPDGVSNPTMEQAVRRNIWTAFGIAGVVPIIGGLIGGLAELAAVIVIAVNISSDNARRQHAFDKFAGGTQVLKVG